MKHPKVHALLGGIFLLGALANDSNAQAPNSIAGDALAVEVTGGSGTFATNGWYLLLPANSGPGYQLIGIQGITNSSGTYSYSTSNTLGILDLSDSIIGPASGMLTFDSNSAGQIDLTSDTNEQSGNFVIAAGTALPSFAEHSFFLTILAGQVPFANQGSVIFSTSASGSNYIVVPTSGGIAASSGTYSYTITNSSTGYFGYNDALTGVSSEYFGFQGTNSGFYLVSQPHSGGFQFGTFAVSNLIPTLFFMGQIDLGTHAEYLTLTNGTLFGYYDIMDFTFPLFYHYDMGFEWYFDATNAAHGCYLYDFSSSTFFYTDIQTWPFLYDFTLNTWLYYYPDTSNPGHYTSNPRSFYDFATGKVINK